MSQLSQIFTNIANAIRSKTGSNELITPPEMATAIDNIPSGGSATAYAWDFSEDGDPAGRAYFDFDVAPEDETEFNSKKRIRFNTTITISSNSMSVYDGYTKQSNTQFYMIQEGGIETVYTRADSSNDINIWEWVPTGGGGGGEEEG